MFYLYTNNNIYDVNMFCLHLHTFLDFYYLTFLGWTKKKHGIKYTGTHKPTQWYIPGCRYHVLYDYV